MKTALFSALAFTACASLAVAEDGSTTAGADPAGPVALTEAQMDQVTAGGEYTGDSISPFDLIWDLDGGTTDPK